MKVVFFYSCNEAFKYLLAVSVISLIQNNKTKYEYDIVIFNPDFTEETKEKFLTLVKTASLEVPVYKGNYTTYKFFDFMTILSEYDDNTACLVLDADTLIRSSFDTLIDHFFNTSKTLGVVREFITPWSVNKKIGDFNMGCILIHLGRYRENKIEELLFQQVEIERKNDKRFFSDQTYMNKICESFPHFVYLLEPK